MKRRQPIARYSLKKIQQLNDEHDIRVELCKRAEGKPYEWRQLVKRNGETYTINRVICINGKCECSKVDPQGCDQQFSHILEPHHLKRRSNGGEFTLDNIVMVRRQCHDRLDERKVKLQWISHT